MKNSIIVNAVFNMLAGIVSLATTFFLVPLLVSSLGDAQYGLYMLVMSVSGFFGIMTFGLGDATIRFVAHYYSMNDIVGVNRVFRSTLLVYLVVGLATALVILLIAAQIISLFTISPKEIELAISLLRYAAFGFIFTLVNSVLNAVPQALQRYDITTKIAISTSLIQSILTAIMLLRGEGIIVLIWIGIGVQLFSIIVNYFVVRHLLPTLQIMPSFSVAGMREVFGYGVFSFIAQIFGIASLYSDRLLTGAFVSSGSVGFLTVPQDIAFRSLTLVGQAGNVLFPRFSIVKDVTVLSKLYLQSSWAMLLISSMVFAPWTIFMPDFIGLWISPSFAEKCSLIGQLIAISSVVRGNFIVYESLFKGINKPQYVTVLSFVVGMISLAINIILIPRFGVIGAGYSYCITAIFGLIVIAITWKYVLENINWKPLITTLFIPMIIVYICIACGFVLRSYYPPTGWISLIAEMGMTSIITAVIYVVYDIYNNLEDSNFNAVRKSVLNSMQIRAKLGTSTK
jgi:O-antigen/teichoic acid export membrane protein